MEKKVPKHKYSIMNDLSLAVSVAAEKPVYFDTESDKQVKQSVANKFICEHLKVKKHKFYGVDDRFKLKHFHVTQDAIVLIGGKYIYVKGENYYSFDDIDINEKIVSAWFMSETDAENY